jgi:CheY-like chemotaxis protein
MVSTPDILVIEDDDDLRRVLADSLRLEGYGVAEAAHGRVAVDYLESRELPRVILLDLMMPVMNGWEFRDAQARDPRLASIPVVVITADNSAVHQAARAGVAGCLLKPLEFPELLSYVGRYCGA